MISQADIPTALHLQLKVKCHFLWNVTLEFYSQIGISRPPLGQWQLAWAAVINWP